jgi:hypothetical protein
VSKSFPKEVSNPYPTGSPKTYLNFDRLATSARNFRRLATQLRFRSNPDLGATEKVTVTTICDEFLEGAYTPMKSDEATSCW